MTSDIIKDIEKGVRFLRLRGRSKRDYCPFPTSLLSREANCKKCCNYLGFEWRYMCPCEMLGIEELTKRVVNVIHLYETGEGI